MKFILTVLLFVAMLFVKPSVATAQRADVSDSLALVDLYNSTNGAGWYNTWDLNKKVEGWYGVGLDRNGKVVTLALSFNFSTGGNNMRGSLPSSLGNLSNLTILELGGNYYISGVIPPSFGNLIKLTTLNLEFNQLSGNIPSSLGNLTHLTYLNLERNDLSGPIPSSIGNLSNLTNLNLAGNQFSGSIPSSLGNLSHLSYLKLSNNQLTGSVPAALCTFPDSNGLEIDMSSNKLIFTGMECLAQRYVFTKFKGQTPDVPIIQDGDILSVNVGGTLSYNTYYWFKKFYETDNWHLISTVKGDSTLKISTPGIYLCDIVDSIIYKSDPETVISSNIDTIRQSLAVKLLQPDPGMIDTNGNLINDPTKIDTLAIVKGAATDGISKVLLVLNSSTEVRFTLNSKKDGSLSALDGTKYEDTSITVLPVNGRVVAVYTAPDGYGLNTPISFSDDGRGIIVHLDDELNDTTNAIIQLITPPVVLVHGMWSNPNAWRNGGFLDYLNIHGIFKVYLADYTDANSQTFDPDNPESQPARDAIYKQIIKAQNDAAKEGIIATQVDVVGHSLGGLQTRSFSQDPRFKDPLLNYNKGFIHKLITIGTPHLGSEWGPILYYGDKYLAAITASEGNPSYIAVSTLLGMITKMKIGSCHRDFNPSFKYTGKGLDNLTETNSFKVHAIEARWDTFLSDEPETNGWSIFTSILNYIYKGSQTAINGTLDVILRDASSDIIVPRYSQLGGIAGYYDEGKNYYDHFDNTTHSDLFLDNVIKKEQTETTNQDIQKQVTNLLLTDSLTNFTTGFPAPNTIFTPFDFEISNRSASRASPPNRQIISITANELRIISPHASSVFKNHGHDSITLRLTFSDSTKLANSVFLIQDAGFIAMPSTPPYMVKIALPKSVNSGRLNLVALGNDIYGNIYTDTLSVGVLAADTLKSISASPVNILLDSLTRQTALHVEGVFTNGKDTTIRDITSESSGTAYSSQANSIIAITSDGNITGNRAGVDTVLIKNQNISATVAVQVDSSLFKAAKFVNIIDFTVQSKSVYDLPFALTATASSGQEVTYSLITGPVNLKNGIVTINGTGIVTIKATSPATPYFDSAVSVIRSFAVTDSKKTYSFTGNGNWSYASNWSDGIVPPAILPNGSEIVISPSPNSECILDVSQTISTGAILTIKNKSEFKILGNLLIKQ